MDTFTFGSLCREASRLLGIADPDELAREGQVTLDGVEIGLIFDEEHVDRLFCYIDIGSVESLESSVGGLAIYRDMLTLNLLRGSKTAGVIALDPENNRLLLSSHLSNPDSYDGEQLATALRNHASDSVLARELWTVRLEAQASSTPTHQMPNLA